MNKVSIEVNGSIIAGLQWGDSTKPVLLAVHGWLDNAASFVPLADNLLTQLADGSLPYQLIAIDLPGHGLSTHKIGHYNFIEWVDDLYQIVTSQNWGPVSIIGHSMGAMITSIFAAAFPELVKQIVLVEGLGAISAKADETVSQLRKGIESRAIYNSKIKQSTKRRSNALTLSKIIKARCLVSDLNEDNAALICNRNLTTYNGDVIFRSDQKLKTRSLVRLTELQVIDILSSISTACLMILGSDGFPLITKTLEKDIFNRVNFTRVEVSGGHHVHMDNPTETATAIVKFVNN
ncbi:alpha/beta fold hydrolase [Moritella marina]|uniref:alpha/beta fold hydrolase n=1 Tax=Moritella marina TaxID=90736 RepID=UPI0037049BA4